MDLYSAPCIVAAEQKKHVPAIKNCMLIRLISIRAVFTAQKYCLIGEVKEFVFSLQESSSTDLLNLKAFYKTLI